ncbi:MarR family transcriptional regulator [Corynebacterium variabile]|uniref:MarR family transcriptional regulator n=1 Tax=Corynebacterium TaxID=1716 RepID=UPI00264738CD|nr:MarR family transcriptional regulator [Corynebacterium sp.]MDN6281549.1 MarR family transcriptional regulator [Corynebacterium sp.]MDN6304475.1 MarR family transcriptional regulator [Corynebacterium sp.]MDN6352778.1 MarR family transcriptional regulator [Corynebacterium sp.]MDN6366326.1 MarR family transcriptional regulator [Corynebacterium sp.]MDN6374823.1 MarR family transcriptional regulator [Corynebacterium sp.]
MSKTGSGELLFSFARHWSRRSAIDDAVTAEQGRLLLTLEAVASLIDRGQSATVTAVASEIGIDQSGASRLVKSAVDAGYVAMTTSQTDRRRREVTVMPSGDAVLREAHAWQEQVFGELTVGWSRLRREEFHAAMTDLVRRSYLTDVEPQDGDCSGVAGSADPTSGTVVSAGDDWLDAVEAAEWVGCSVWTIRRWVRDGKLSAWKRVASGTDGRRAVKSFVRRSELDEKFRLDSQAEHVNRIREGAAPFSDGQKESLRQVFSDHVLERERGRSQESRGHMPVEEVESSPVGTEARSASNMAQGARRVGSVKRKRQGSDDA